MKPYTAWLLKHFPYSVLVRNQSLFLRLGSLLFIVTLLYTVFFTKAPHPVALLLFTTAFILLFISSYLPRKETRITNLVTQSGALELLDLSPVAVFTYEKKDGDIFIRFANRACHTMFALGKKNLAGQPISQLVMLEDEEEMLTVCLETLESEEKGINRTFFIRGRKIDGENIKLIGVTAQIKWLEDRIGICFLFDAAEEEHHLEMQSHLHEGYKSTLVAGIVHDFRNVLTSIIGTAEALQFDMKDKRIIEQLDIIIDAAERGSNTITEILQLSSAKYTNDHEEYRDIRPDLKSIVTLLRLQLPAHIKLSCNIENDIPPVRISTSQLEQILMNLVNNAAQAMDKDYGHIAIHAKSCKADKSCMDTDAVRIIVSDNGRGISEENLPFVTDNFWTLRKSSGGTGLGLAMVKRIVTHLGGELEIKSQLGVGTQVCICFPLQNKGAHHMNKASPSKETQEAVKKTPTAPFQPKPCTILLVDDQSNVLHVQQMLLEAMGHTVITAMHGASAIEAFERASHSIDMLVTDFKMPDMDGIELAKTLREKDPSLPLLMITAYGETEKLRFASDLNMTIILKPTNLKKFSEAIAQTQLKYPNKFS